VRRAANEVHGRPAAVASVNFHFPWYDLASAGTRADTVHITNMTGITATGSINLTGQTAIPFSVSPGQDLFFAFPTGTIGGPVTVASSQNVLVSLRAWYYQSFNEVGGY
jgi:hypothetical protein